jgi:hypothetical protein
MEMISEAAMFVMQAACLLVVVLMVLAARGWV